MTSSSRARGAAGHPDPERRPKGGRSKPRLLEMLGPGLVAGASDDDPSGIATYSQAGAQFGYTLCWTMLFTFPLMAAVQEISARIGRTTGQGLAGNVGKLYPAPVVYFLVALVFIANTINIGANLGAMGDALALLVGGPRLLFVAAFAALCVALEIFMQYTRYVAVLKWLTLALFSYVATLFVVEIPWGEMARGTIVPTLAGDGSYWQMVVAILGTTISPYLFFWQAEQEVEDMHDFPRRRPLRSKPGQAKGALARIRLDTLAGMAFSNFVALAIIVTVAATLHRAGITNIESSAQAAEALRPVAGDLAFALFTLGIIGTGLLSVPVLAGSAAFAFGEALHWKVGLARQPTEAKAFYAALSVATVVGMALNFLNVSPIKALYWSAIINGVVAAPIIVSMMLMSSSERVMGKFTIGGPLRSLGWVTAAAMALSVVVMVVTQFT